MGQYTESRIEGRVAELELIREDKRNAMSDGLIAEIDAFYAGLPAEVRVVVLHGRGGHYCAGLDLSEHVHRSAEEGVHHSRNWHRVMDLIQFGGRVTVSAMTGAVIGGGLELATATHVRIAEPSVIFQLPEGRRGIFVGGGATARVGRILGADRLSRRAGRSERRSLLASAEQVEHAPHHTALPGQKRSPPWATDGARSGYALCLNSFQRFDEETLQNGALS